MPVSNHTRHSSKDFKTCSFPAQVPSGSPTEGTGNPKDPLDYPASDNELSKIQKQNKNIQSSLQATNISDQSVQTILQQLVSLNQSLLTRIDNSTHDYRILDSKITSLENEKLLLASSQKVSDLETELVTIRNSYVPDSKINSLEQDLADLKLAIPPPKKKNKPKITDLSTVPAPPVSTYLLASKTVKLKDLHNSLMNLKFTSDKIDDIKQMYAMIRQAIDIGCSTTFLLPDIDHKKEVPNFFEVLVPNPNH